MIWRCCVGGAIGVIVLLAWACSGGAEESIVESSSAPDAPIQNAEPAKAELGTMPQSEATSIQIRGRGIKIGDTADYVFSILKQDDMVKQDVDPDPRNPQSLAVTKYYRLDGKSYILSFARKQDPGPYVVTKIVIE